jgi:hypothetical protein
LVPQSLQIKHVVVVLVPLPIPHNPHSQPIGPNIRYPNIPLQQSKPRVCAYVSEVVSKLVEPHLGHLSLFFVVSSSSDPSVEEPGSTGILTPQL